ncbi:class I SAM-dependent methyltransferase [Chlorobium sp. BLA1]|uniref:class I SAM-dependent methyltransferase n=1 Tax=Candidatus Chlorobium masyuteum TaxID=2716876 RepID=UPI00141E45B5|nr:class I SAM-dependent methyltransferase [Candidatus Chlorobium masyuteum]NHQ59181.1 class I SAM-dependent methyltransferase [Candidatus Chlorobium masyuteum]
MNQFDRYTDDYNALLNESLSLVGGFNDYYLSRKVEVVKKYIGVKKIKFVLDFGCGLGDTSLMLRNAYPDAQIIGVDISELSIERAREKYQKIDFFCISDEEFIATYTACFDVIYVANVFHHVPINERVQVIGILKTMLACKGQIFFFEHNPYNPLTKWVVSRCEFDQDAILLLSRETRMLFKSSGFHIERTVYFLFFPYMFRNLSKIEDLFSWLPFGAQYCVVASLI